MFSYRNFNSSAFTFRSMFNLSLIFCYYLRLGGVLFFPHVYEVVPSIICGKIYPFNYFDLLNENKVTMYMWVYFWPLYVYTYVTIKLS